MDANPAAGSGPARDWLGVVSSAAPDPSGTPPPAPGRPARTRGGSWTARDQPTTIWLVLAGAAALAHHWWPSSGWVVVHLVVLGALSHSVLVWSTHFAQALLRSDPGIDPRRHQSIRLWTLTAGAALVILGVPLAHPVLVMAGASLVVAAVAWHAWALVRRVRAALPGRFRITLHYYVAASACLAVGATFGILLSLGPSPEHHGRLLLAHTLTMLLGWLGLTVTGTLLTLWPTMLRTRMDDRAERLATQALPVFLLALTGLDAAALLGWRRVALGCLAGWLAGLAWWGRALLAPTGRRPPQEFGPASVGSALVWAVVALLRVCGLLLHGPDFAAVYAGYGPAAALIGLGFGLQILLGALTYLIPVVLGGGPATSRFLNARLNRWGATRLVLTNAAVATFVLPMPGAVRTALQLLGLAAASTFLPLMAGAIKAFVQAHRRHEPLPDPGAPGSFWTPFGVGAAVVAMVAASAVASGTTTSAPVRATGHTTSVTVTARDMHFVPDHITVPRGDRLLVTLVNADDTTSHDLVLPGGQNTGMVRPHATGRLDAGVQAVSQQGWCSVPGHRQMGMVLSIDVDGGAPVAGVASANGGMGTGGSMAGTQVQALAEHPFDPGFVTHPAELAPLTDATTHTVAWHVRDERLQVAPGVWQTRWTYATGNAAGSAPGPTLHGRIGDRFVVSITNDTGMGHSIDFHAGEVSPDRNMATIPPGGHLTYVFTATHAGAWLYHCSTMPMATHIAAGMFGAVVVEPDHLPAVAHQWLLVQSEVFWGQRTARRDADQVDAARIGSGRPDAVVFNGAAFQYLRQPLAARVGQRARIWVVDAGPDEPLSFHVVGTQFDTVWAEGAYRLRPGGGGAAQALALSAAQGGFVEMQFHEPGHYRFVNHMMGDAERGAEGFIVVTR